MSPACYRYFLRRETRPIRGFVVDETTRAARLVFEAIMSAPDIRVEGRKSS